MTVNPEDPRYLKYQIPDQKHHAQSRWQIWVPFIVILLLLFVFFASVMIVTSNGALELGRVSTAAIILMIVLLALTGVFGFIFLVVVIVWTNRTMRFIPRLRLLSMQVDSIADVITTWSNRLMLPFIVASRVKTKNSDGRKKALKD